MNREQLYKLLHGLENDGIICYAYRETVFSILSDGKCDGTVYLITDASADALSDALMKRDFKEITRIGDGIDAKLAQQNVRIRLIGDMEKLSKTICQPLTVCSMMLRADGGVYDELGGMDDLNGKVLRKTAAPIRDKNYFCTLCFEIPSPWVELPCGSISISSTRKPLAPRQALRFTQVVVFPTPPFWFVTAITFPISNDPFFAFCDGKDKPL